MSSDRAASAPTAGRDLAILDRRDSEVRISLAEYEGRPFVRLEAWAPSPGGRWKPVPGRMLSIRLHETEKVVAALRRAVELAGGPVAPTTPRVPARHDGEARRADGPPWEGPGGLPLREPESEPFDETAGSG